MEKLIELSVSFILEGVASFAKSRWHLPDFADKALDELFQMNKLERDVSALSSQLNAINEAIGELALRERTKRTDEWTKEARLSKSEKVRYNEDIVKHVARQVHGLHMSGVKELVIVDSKHVTATIGQVAFMTNAEETLASIVEIATSDSHIERVEATGDELPRQSVVLENRAVWRLNFITDLVDVLSSQWDGGSCTRQDPRAREQQLFQLKNNLCTSWIVPDTEQEIVSSLKTVTFRQLAKMVNGSHPTNSEVLNVFIVGSEKSGKSTTSFLLSGKGRDYVSQLLEPTTKISAKEVNFGDYLIKVWDTPGLNVGPNLHRARMESLRDKMRSVNGISAVILQTTLDGYTSDQEISIISRLQSCLRKPLNQSLMISFKADPLKNKAAHVQNWESVLSSRRVGTIGISNYIHFDAPNLSYANCEEVCTLNRSAVEAVKELITKKDITVDKSNWRASEDILNCQDARDSEQKNELRLLYAEESSDHIKSVLEGARKTRASMENEDLVFKVRSGCIVSSPFRFAKRLWSKSSGQDFALETTGALSMNMVKKILPDPNRTRIAKHKQQNMLARQIAPLVERSRKKSYVVGRGCQKLVEWKQNLDEWRQRDYIENWIAIICNDSFEFYPTDNMECVRDEYLIFERDCYVTEKAIDIVMEQLGPTVVLELLNEVGVL